MLKDSFTVLLPDVSTDAANSVNGGLPGLVHKELILRGEGSWGRGKVGAADAKLILPEPTFGSGFVLVSGCLEARDPRPLYKRGLCHKAVHAACASVTFCWIVQCRLCPGCVQTSLTGSPNGRTVAGHSQRSPLAASSPRNAPVSPAQHADNATDTIDF